MEPATCLPLMLLEEKCHYNFLLLNDKNTLVSTKFSENVFKGLKQGRYRCIVADKDDCTLEKFIDVK